MGKAHDRSAQTGSVGWVSPSVAEARQESKHPSVASLYRSFADAEEAAAAAQQEALAELQPMLQLFGKRGELGEILFTKAALLEAVLVQRFDRLREQAETLFHAPDPGAAFFDFFSHLVADAAGKIAIAEALFEAGGDNGGDAAQASYGLRRAVDALLQHAQRAGTVRDDVELPEVYALLVATSRASAHAHLEEEARDRMLTIIFDGLSPLRNARAQLKT